MFIVVPRTETRFWPILRCLVIPLTATSLLLCVVAAVVTALGGNTPVMDGRQVRGLEGVLVCLAAFPLLAGFLTFAFAGAVWLSRRKLRRS